MELREDTVLRKLAAMDAFRRPERFEQFLVACEADARGRTGYEDTPYPQAARFREYFAAASNIDISTVLAQGLPGHEIAAAIQQTRINAIMQKMTTLSDAAQSVTDGDK